LRSFSFRHRIEADRVAFLGEWLLCSDWLERLQSDSTVWIELGFGCRIVEWIPTAAIEDPSLPGLQHDLRYRIDAVLDRLIAFGVAEAHEFEQRMQAGRAGPPVQTRGSLATHRVCHRFSTWKLGYKPHEMQHRLPACLWTARAGDTAKPKEPDLP
jgi:hypothetical protein